MSPLKFMGTPLPGFDPFDGKTSESDVGRGFVYVIGWKDSPYVKVGLTRNLPNRLIGIQSSCPYKLTLERKILCMCDDPQETEQYLHDRLQQHQAPAGNEWFKRGPALRAADKLLGVSTASTSAVYGPSGDTEVLFYNTPVAQFLSNLKESLNIHDHPYTRCVRWVQDNLPDLPSEDYFREYYDYYTSWCDENDYPVLTRMSFSKFLLQAGAKRVKRHRDNGWLFRIR